MDTKVVVQTSQATLAGLVSFADLTVKLYAAGVEYYRVDYIAMAKTFYGAEGDMMLTPIIYEGMPPVSTDLDVEALRAIIADSQRNRQTHRDFTRRAMLAGVQGYIVFMRGKRVTYWGRGGDQHTEWFPGAVPGKPAS